MAEQKETIIKKGTGNVEEDYVKHCSSGCADRS
jgi:hypothetical protein